MILRFFSCFNGRNRPRIIDGQMIYDVRGFDPLSPSYIRKDMSKVLDQLSKIKLDQFKSAR